LFSTASTDALYTCAPPLRAALSRAPARAGEAGGGSGVREREGAGDCCQWRERVPVTAVSGGRECRWRRRSRAAGGAGRGLEIHAADIHDEAEETAEDCGLADARGAVNRDAVAGAVPSGLEPVIHERVEGLGCAREGGFGSFLLLRRVIPQGRKV